jgi:ribonuclease E
MHDENNTTGDNEQGTPAADAGGPPARKRAPRRRAASRPAGPPQEALAGDSSELDVAEPDPQQHPPGDKPDSAAGAPSAAGAAGLLFKAPEFVAPDPAAVVDGAETTASTGPTSDDDDDEDGDGGTPRRRRRRGGRGRRKKPDDGSAEADDSADEPRDADASDAGDAGGDSDAEAVPAARDADQADDEAADGQSSGGSRRRRRRKRKGDGDDSDGRSDDPPNTVVKVREPRDVEDEVTKVTGSTRLEAKKQRRREGREAGRRRAPVISESEFLARREAVERVMAVRQSGDRTQIAVLEDGVLVEHYVSRASDQPLIGNIYLGRVQNVLPAMEAAFIDIGRGRNAVLYAGEVDWAGFGHTDGQKRIEEVLRSGQSVLVQVTKEPAGHKGARLTSQISLPGRYVVYVPGGSMSGISRKLPEKERNRLKKILKQVVPDDAGVIVRTAAEGASEEELTHDVSRLRAQWDDIRKKTSGNGPQLLYGEPDLAIKVVRDLFNEDFAKLVVSGDEAWETIEPYVSYVASSLRDRLEKWAGDGDVFAAYRVDEQIAKALERKVWLPSGGSLVIDRTEAMTVVDVNTGKFTGSGGNLEETVTKNNLEAAEEIVRQLRLRDIGGIIVIDFIDMVLEANRDLVLRRLVECLGRDRTKHQVAEVTSLGLVQMTRKRIGSGLLEAFSEQCEYCSGRGLHIHTEPVIAKKAAVAEPARTGRGSRRDRRRKGDKVGDSPVEASTVPKLEATATPGDASPADLIPVDAAKQVAADAAPSQVRTVPEAPAGADVGPDANTDGGTDGGPGVSVDVSTADSSDVSAADSSDGPPEPAVEASAEPVVADAAASEGEARGAERPAADDAADDAHTEHTAPASPAKRRGRRRAARPAGSPDQDSKSGGASADSSVVTPV